ncbi:flagellar P-ring protein [Bryobacterales bacterium F-183]|nr:flagellar P-ring protein [Bryobacterales bacterium F-183]
MFHRSLSLLLIVLCRPVDAAVQSRVRDLVSVEGVRDNQLVGYGLVVGLNGTGDKRQTIFSAQSLANMLARVGVTVPAAAFQVRNTAAVIVTATLPPYAQTGGRIDITVGAIGDASNLQGGILVQTSLRGADGAVYAAAQGPVVTGGFAAGRGGNSQTMNHPTVGRISGGALIEKSAPTPELDPRSIRLQLHKADPEMATTLVSAINSSFQAEVAKAVHPGLIAVSVPTDYQTKRVEFLGKIESLPISRTAGLKIIINERTGTIVMGKDVPISPVSILHGALTVEVQTRFDVSQPAPLSTGQTTVVPEQRVQAKEERAKSVMLKDGATVEDLVRGLQAIGATARDVIAILDAIRAAGALQADLEVI